MGDTAERERLERAKLLIEEARLLVDGAAPTAHEQLGVALASIRAVLSDQE